MHAERLVTLPGPLVMLPDMPGEQRTINMDIAIEGREAGS